MPFNKPSKYKTILHTPVKLTGAWEVALLETHYPHQIPNFETTILVVICTDDVQEDHPNRQQPIPSQSQISQSTTDDPSGKQTEPPRAVHQYRGKAHLDQVAGHWPSGEDNEDLDIDVVNDQSAPQPQAETQPMKEADKKP